MVDMLLIFTIWFYSLLTKPLRSVTLIESRTLISYEWINTYYLSQKKTLNMIILWQCLGLVKKSFWHSDSFLSSMYFVHIPIGSSFCSFIEVISFQCILQILAACKSSDQTGLVVLIVIPLEDRTLQRDIQFGEPRKL